MKDLQKILYAEDEPDVQTVVELTIESMSDYSLKVCSNGKELLNCVEEYNPDLILLDVMMPEMDGPTTFEHLKKGEKTKDIPIIFMTAKAQTHEVEMFKNSGAIGIITNLLTRWNSVRKLKEFGKTIAMSENLQDKLKILAKAYINKLENHAVELSELAEQNNFDIDKIYSTIHTIVGTSGMYGFSRISELSTSLELYIKSIKDDSRTHNIELKSKQKSILKTSKKKFWRHN